MKKKLLIFSFLTLNIIASGLQAAVNPEELIKDIFQKTGKENLLLNTKMKEEVESHIDFGEMSKSILAQEYAKRSASDLKWFETTLKEIITRSVYPSAPKFLENVKITYKKTKTSDADAKVSSSVSKKGESTDVDYVLKKVNNEWKVVDVAIDEESWVKTINEKVQKTIKEKGWNGLKDLLNKRLTELKSSKKS
ncbi:MAG: ABC transporter substrate-binding protein [Bacteriovorax sp.]